MAAYHRVYDSRHLQPDCQEPGSAPEPCGGQSSTGCLYLFTRRVIIYARQRHEIEWLQNCAVQFSSSGPVWARGRCRISPPRFLAECFKRQLNQGSFVLLYFRLFTFSELH